MRRLNVAVGLTLAALVAAGCARESGTPDARPTVQELTSEQVTFGEQVAQIRGHHLAAATLYKAGDGDGAVTHTGHPVEELLASIESDVRDENAEAAEALGPALRAASQVVADEGSVEALNASIEEAARVVDDAEAAVAGDLRASSRYRASVIAALLNTVNGEYGEAVQDGKVSLLAEWQDAFAFSRIAREMYADVRGDVESASAEEAAEIKEAFETLDEIIPSIEPPDAFRPAEDLERATALIGAELEETVDALLLKTVEPEQAFDNIDGLLTQILEKYRAGDRDEAAELSAQAYLENYELVEAEVIELAPDVNKELEPLLGAELRARIREGVPVSQIESMIGRARTLLRQARDAVLEHE